MVILQIIFQDDTCNWCCHLILLTM